MNNKLSIQDLASALAGRNGMDAKSAAIFVKTVFEIVEEYISKDKLVKIKGLGTFKLVSVSDRESVNVNTGERILIAGHSKLSFTPDAALKDAVNRPFSDFETTLLRDTTSTEDMERIPSAELEDNNVDAYGEADVDVDEMPVEEHVEPVAMELLPISDEKPEEDAVVPTVPEDIDMDNVPEKELPRDDDTALTVAEEDNAEVGVMPNVNDSPQENTGEQNAGSSADSNAHDNSAYPMSTEVINTTGDGKHRIHGWIYALLTLLLMALSYICGHYRVLDNLEINLYPEDEMEEENIVVKPLANDACQQMLSSADSVLHSQDTIKKDSALVDSVVVRSQVSDNTKEENPAEVAKYFPQVPNGSYWIVGDAGHVHCMEPGETLYRVAKKELGSQDFVRYLIAFNKFEDPNVIHTGDTIRIPKLVKK